MYWQYCCLLTGLLQANTCQIRGVRAEVRVDLETVKCISLLTVDLMVFGARGE